ncbi:MAG: rod shape-determining protein MreC [bacterium]
MNGKSKNFSLISFFLLVFFTYELIAIKYNFYSLSLQILSLINLKNYGYESKKVNLQKGQEKIIKSIIYNNPLYKGDIAKFLYSVEIICISNVISFSKEYFYIENNGKIKVFDTVVNEKNFLGIVENETSKIARVRYIKSNAFQIPAKIIKNNEEIRGFIKTSSKIHFYPLNNNQNDFSIYNNTPIFTAGFYQIPSGIPIGIIDNNEVKLYKEIWETEQVIVIRRIQ